MYQTMYGIRVVLFAYGNKPIYKEQIVKWIVSSNLVLKIILGNELG